MMNVETTKLLIENIFLNTSFLLSRYFPKNKLILIYKKRSEKMKPK